MAFLDNSGDIILDAVLTDAGRKRMAQGAFKITKFAFGDEEINYSLYNPNDSRGSIYYDRQIMQTPILESFTNNTSTMHSKVITIGRANILHMPILTVNAREGLSQNVRKSLDFKTGFIMTANEGAQDIFGETIPQGVLFGAGNAANLNPNRIAVDQGIISNGDPSSQVPIDDDLKETRYLIQMDHRLLRLHDHVGFARQKVSFVDDDNIAAYFIPFDGRMITDIGTIAPDASLQRVNQQIYDGPLGTRFQFRLGAALNIQKSTALFDELGPGSKNTMTINKVTGFQYLDTLVKITGIGTGYSIDIPIRIVRRPTSVLV